MDLTFAVSRPLGADDRREVAESGVGCKALLGVSSLLSVD